MFDMKRFSRISSFIKRDVQTLDDIKDTRAAMNMSIYDDAITDIDTRGVKCPGCNNFSFLKNIRTANIAILGIFQMYGCFALMKAEFKPFQYLYPC